MKRFRLTAAALAIGVAALSMSAIALAAMGPGKWVHFQTGLTYRLYKPSNTLHQKQNSLKTVNCGTGHEPWVAATYGTYRGVLKPHVHGFALYEGHPICADPGTSSRIKAPKIKGAKGKVYAGVYCDAPKHCTKAQGFKKGFTVQWTMKASKPYHKTTQMQVDGAHMHWRQVVAFIHGLKKVG